MSFESLYERFAACARLRERAAGGWWLRFYARNSRFQAMYLLTLPLVGFLTFNFGRTRNGPGLLCRGARHLAMVSFLGTRASW